MGFYINFAIFDSSHCPTFCPTKIHFQKFRRPSFHIFSNKPIESVDDLKGMRVRTTNTYRAFLEAAGSIPVSTSRGEIYTSLERGVVDAYINIPSEVKPNLERIAAEYQIQHVPLTVYEGATGPPGYNVKQDASVNVMMWEGVVKANRAYQAGQLKPEEIKEVIADTKLIVH